MRHIQNAKKVAATPLGVTHIYSISLELNSLEGYKDPYVRHNGRNKYSGSTMFHPSPKGRI